MCCFSGKVERVSGTRIFARALGNAQALVYSMNVSASAEVAMVLPIPVPARSAEDAVRFVSLERYPDFFEDVRRAFPMEAQAKGPFLSRSFAPQPATLVVHEVGDFEASFVPTIGDFDRLDRRFALPRQVWDRLPQYADWGFAVFKLKGFDRSWFAKFSPWSPPPRSFHPMAFVFPRRDPQHLFFPTVHVHDGEVHDEAEFDHALYLQGSPSGWELGDTAGRYVDVSRAEGLVDAEAPVHRRVLLGRHRNADVWA